MKKKSHTPHITDEERAIFKEYTQGIQPLKDNTQAFESIPKKPVKPHIDIRPSREVQRLDVGDTTPSVQPEDILQFARPGVQHRILQKMRRGNIQIEAELDLHGMNLDQAEERLSSFLMQAIEAKWRYVLVIHGKGISREAPYPILKNKVNQWLRAHPDVLAFCSANPFQGGAGAVYVLLRRER